MKRLLRSVVLATLLSPYACSGGDDPSEVATQDGGPNASGESGDPGNPSNPGPTGVPSSSSTGDPSVNLDAGSMTTTTLGDGEACVATVTTADLVDIDIHLMLDSSGSMLDQLPNGSTKWDAIVESLINFVEDPNTADIGIGLQYFPQQRENTSIQCDTNSDCGPGAGPCSSSICMLELSEQGVDYFGVPPPEGDEGLALCENDAACGANQACKAWLGICSAPDPNSGDPTFLGDADDNLLGCETSADCITGSTCDLLGICEFADDQGDPILCSDRVLGCPADAGDCFLIPNVCTNATLCEPQDYETPAVEISTSANRNDALVASLNDHEPDLQSLTPTGPALAGAIEHAQARETADPTRKVVAVLATDGFPTICDPIEIADISDIAQAGVDGSPSVETYVIGVFAAAEAQEAQSNLDQIAQAGATDEAFVITTGGDLSAQFLAALEEIRGAALACDFTIPEPSSGDTLDFGQVNLEFSDGGGDTRQLINVADEGACSNAPTEGWYYVRDPQTNQPTQITVCPEVCNDFEAATGAQVNLQIGCDTIVY